MRWSDLEPDVRLLGALDAADLSRGDREDLVKKGSASAKNNWSNTFADECARMVSAAIESHAFTKGLTVLPGPGHRAEPPTITYRERGKARRKKIDVLAGDLIAGLQVAVSLKGVGFRDRVSQGYGKNITGRLYELENEARRLHEYRPHATVVALYFVPLAAVADKKTARTPSGFADIVTNLRALTGRSDPYRQDEWHRVDLGFVGLYATGAREQAVMPGVSTIHRQDPSPRGAVRYFDVRTDPPERGRPDLASTLSLPEVVDVVAKAHVGSASSTSTWAAPEPD